jgi:branched-chain amino acid transport system substrate-binding protein
MKIGFRIWLLFLLGLSGCSFGAAPATIDIGHVSDKSRLDKAGEQAERGMRLALIELNKDDALTQAFAGRKVQIRHTDTRGQLEAFESEAVRLDSINRCVALLGGLSSAETTALQNAKVPLLTFHGQPVPGGNASIIYLGMAPVRQGAVLAKVVADDKKAKKITIVLDEKRPEGVATAEAFQKTLQDTRKDAILTTVPFVYESVLTPADGKATTRTETPVTISAAPRWPDLVQRLMERTPDAVVFAGGVQDFNAWRQELRKQVPKARPQLIFAGPDGAERQFDAGEQEVLFATAFHGDPAAEKPLPFVKAYKEAFHTDPDVNAALAYDGFRILIKAMKETPTQLTPERLREELLKTKDFEGVTGSLTITPERQVARPLFVVRWRNGKGTAVKTFPPE